jgi:DNA-binding XRE family transcriptional regulator
MKEVPQIRASFIYRSKESNTMKAKSLTAQLKKASVASAETVAERLIALRADRALSQARLAELAGVDRKTINRIENGHFSPSLDTLTRLSVVLKCRLSELVEAKRTKR